MKYKKLTGVILKKQNYREADQIVSCWTREAGKVRVLAKALRLPKSKLAYALQDLSMVEIHSVGRNLPTLIGAKPLNQFNGLRIDLKKAAMGFYAAELMLKMTADEHPNTAAFDLLANFLQQLDLVNPTPDYPFVDSFALNLAQILGFGTAQHSKTHRDVRNFIENLIERQLQSEPFLISI